MVARRGSARLRSGLPARRPAGSAGSRRPAAPPRPTRSRTRRSDAREDGRAEGARLVLARRPPPAARSGRPAAGATRRSAPAAGRPDQRRVDAVTSAAGPASARSRMAMPSRSARTRSTGVVARLSPQRAAEPGGRRDVRQGRERGSANTWPGPGPAAARPRLESLDGEAEGVPRPVHDAHAVGFVDERCRSRWGPGWGKTLRPSWTSSTGQPGRTGHVEGVPACHRTATSGPGRRPPSRPRPRTCRRRR